MLVIKKKQIRKKDAILRIKKNSIKNGEVSGVPLLNSREVPGHKVWRSDFYVLSNVLRISLRN